MKDLLVYGKLFAVVCGISIISVTPQLFYDHRTLDGEVWIIFWMATIGCLTAPVAFRLLLPELVGKARLHTCAYTIVWILAMWYGHSRLLEKHECEKHRADRYRQYVVDGMHVDNADLLP